MSTLPYPNAEAAFQMQYQAVRRDEVVGVLFALFLGCFGVHHFYLGRTGLGILYLCFCWTGIPAIVSLIECFFMPGRVRDYNAMRAAQLAASLGMPVPAWTGYPGWVAPGNAPAAYPAAYSGGSSVTPYAPAPQPNELTLAACPQCGRANSAGARFCPGCGSKLM